MTNSKKLTGIALSILIGAFTFFLFYLLGCFANNSFDLAKWGSCSLWVIPTFGGIISMIIMGIAFIILLELDK